MITVKCLLVITPLGQRIKSRLRELRQTQTWLADQVGLSPAQMTQIIKGQRGTSVDTLIEIALTLGIDRDEVIRLYRGEKPEKKSSVRKMIELGLDRIEAMDAGRLEQVAQFIELINSSLQGSHNAAAKKRTNKSEN